MDPLPGWAHSREWPAEPASVREARRFVTGRLREHGLTELVDVAELMVSELTTNAILHAGTPFSVTVSQLDGGAEIAVTDGSVHSVPGFPAHVFGLSGRGLHIVDHFGKSWGVRAADGGKTVWVAISAD